MLRKHYRLRFRLPLGSTLRIFPAHINATIILMYNNIITMYAKNQSPTTLCVIVSCAQTLETRTPRNASNQKTGEKKRTQSKFTVALISACKFDYIIPLYTYTYRIIRTLNRRRTRLVRRWYCDFVPRIRNTCTISAVLFADRLRRNYWRRSDCRVQPTTPTSII